MRNVKMIMVVFLFLMPALTGCLPGPGGDGPAGPPVLAAPVSDENGTRSVFINTYFGQPGCSAPSPDNPEGIHYSIDFKVSLPVAGPPGEAPVYAACPGEVTGIFSYPEHTNVLVRYNSSFDLDYNFEPPSRLMVVKGQKLSTGSLIGYLGPCPDDPGHGALDWGLCDNIGHKRICPIPYLSSPAKAKLEEWHHANPNWRPGLDPAGPCICHYPLLKGEER
ncbi:MAG: M23 family metallopeptidase [Firmicutes bacterium]|nr:M23 family metallopeptidase [Bacillota bacterium]